MKEMSFEEHLGDLRKTLIRIVIILSVSFFAAYALSDRITEFLLHPLRAALHKQPGAAVVYLGLLDKVMAQLQVAIWSGVLIASPFWFREIWLFIKPGLYDREAKTILPFIFIGFVLFILGVLFGYYIAFPVTFDVLLNLGVQDVQGFIGLKDYLVLSSKLLLLLGIIFQLPNVLLILGFMGLVTKYSLRSMRRYVYFWLAVFSAVVTPADVITMLAVWFPLIILFELGIFAVAWIVHPYLARQVSSAVTEVDETKEFDSSNKNS